MEDLRRFHWSDYSVFVVMMMLSLATGVYFGIVKKQKRTAEEFLMAGRNMNVVPVSFSVIVSWMSAISLLGSPVECYKYGFVYLALVVGALLALPPIAIWFAPYYNRLRIISAFEFLETSYNKTFRRLASLTMSFMMIIWLGIATYAAALALSQATSLPISLSIMLIGGICTFYTALGGMKAVLWADTIQFFIMLAGQMAIVIRGTMMVGGPSEVLRIAKDGSRINFMDSISDFNPLVRASFWTCLAGGFFTVFVPFTSSQMYIQRFSTVKGPREASRIAWLNMPMHAVMSTSIVVNGLVLYAIYHDCDPYLSGRIERRDQMVPLALIELLGFVPGLPGLFMASIFSASLSSMSSGMNSLAANLLEDFLQPMYRRWRGGELSERQRTFFAKVFALLSGILITIASFLPKVLGSSIYAMTQIIAGTLSGPIGASFFLAIVAPHFHILPVVTGFVIAAVINVWLGVGSVLVEPRGAWDELPISTDGCLSATGSSVTNVTYETDTIDDIYHDWATNQTHNTTTLIPDGPPTFKFTDIYQWNPNLYYASGFLITVFVALIVHYAINWISRLCGKRTSQRLHLKRLADDQTAEQIMVWRRPGAKPLSEPMMAHRFITVSSDEQTNDDDAPEKIDTNKV